MAPTATDDFLNDARKRMVDSQLRPNKVTDPRILAAMRALPREAFLPPALLPLAYADRNVPLGDGRMLLQPMTLARLVQATSPTAGDRVLVVGANTGYAAAVFAALGCVVVALEQAGPLADLAKTALAATSPTGTSPAGTSPAATSPAVTVATGLLPAGWAAGAPYDVILIDGAVPEVPAAIAAQLNRQTGRLVTIVNTGGRTSHAVQAEPAATGLSVRTLFDCLCPVIPAFARAPAFEF